MKSPLGLKHFGHLPNPCVKFNTLPQKSKFQILQQSIKLNARIWHVVSKLYLKCILNKVYLNINKVCFVEKKTE